MGLWRSRDAIRQFFDGIIPVLLKTGSRRPGDGSVAAVIILKLRHDTKAVS